jgi:hypothetical protein
MGITSKSAIAKLNRISKDYIEFHESGAVSLDETVHRINEHLKLGGAGTLGAHTFLLRDARVSVTHKVFTAQDHVNLRGHYYGAWWRERLSWGSIDLSQLCALVVAESWLRGEEAKCHWLIDRILWHFETNGEPLYEEYGSFISFIVRFIAQVTNKPEYVTRLMQHKQPTLHVYQDVLENWASPDLSIVSELLDKSCQYHMREIHRESGYAEFYFVPYEMFAVDVLVWLNERQKHGLEMPELIHPLFRFGCNQLPIQSPELTTEQNIVLGMIEIAASANGLI